VRTAAEWRVEIANRKARLKVTRQAWLRELLVRLVASAEEQLARVETL